MRVREFSGDFFEIGKQEGEIYKKNGMRIDIKIIPSLYKKQLKIYKEYYPEFLEEIEGIASVVKCKKEKLIFNFICGEILFYKRFLEHSGCTAFGVESRKGVFIGRNLDWFPATEKFFEVYKVNFKGKRYSFTGITDMGITTNKPDQREFFYYPDDAINEKGLFISLLAAYNKKWNYGIESIFMTKYIAERCSSVEEAIETFKKTPVFLPMFFFIADKNGKMVVIEHNSKKFKVIYPKDGVLIHTNHYLDKELKREDIILKVNPSHSSFVRYYKTLMEINKRKEIFNFSDVSKILTDKNLQICQNSKLRKTIWSLAIDAKRRKYKLYWDIFEKKKEMYIKFYS
jgi:predicted choloylglycine hydrolase